MRASASIHHNTAADFAGGVYNDGGSPTITMSESASIRHNTAAHAGGVYLSVGTLTMNDSASIHHNTGTMFGGGVYNVAGTLSSAYCGVAIVDNTPDDCLP